ncbi:MAG: hypothetical protein IPI01_02750 [Ignavibacteriae bacterium]|nr:hypothetical protein [Ignavibacteriota bacterium]
MRIHRWSIVLFGVTLALAAASAQAQYWGERAQGKGFEQNEFYFTPANLVPYGLGAFAGTTPGVLRDPLLDLVLSPAHLRLDSLQNEFMIYTDFRASRNMRSNDSYVFPTYRTMDAMYSSIYRPYPTTYLSTRKVLEPVFSGAVIVRPLADIAPELLVGGTYQLMLQDEKYYDVPSDIYKSVMGADYTGRSAAAASDMPIVDRYSGDDNMHQNGHFISLFARYAPTPWLEAGVKFGRVLHDRNGAYGSTNLWNSSYSSQASSLWSSREKRDQGYQHSELSGGLLFHLSDRVTFGISGGHLRGTGTQALSNEDTSYYGYVSNNQYSSMYVHSGGKLSEWVNTGSTTDLGFELRSRLGTRTAMTLFYRPRWSTVALSTASFITDTNSSSSSWTNNVETVHSHSRSQLLDRRTGSGEDKSNTDLFLATFTWDIDQNITLSLGGQLELYSREIRTDEGVEVRGMSEYTTTSTQNPYAYLHENIESKNLHWAFTAKRSSFRVPVFVTIRASRVAGILLGLCRDISRWEINDMTLATFQRRYVNENGTVTDKYNFGERYTQPQETTTDITTTFMAGLTITPSPVFQARVLMVPVFAERPDGGELEQLQWWLGLTVTP